MNKSESIAAARDQLSRILSFFPRVDSKASFLFAVNTSMLAVLATRGVQNATLPWWNWVTIVATLLLLAVSYWHLYKEAFPALDGGQESLIYFREIANRTEAKYVQAWNALSEDEYVNDLLRQVWRNSQILKQKFDHVRYAFYALALSILPWITSLTILSLNK